MTGKYWLLFVGNVGTTVVIWVPVPLTVVDAADEFVGLPVGMPPLSRYQLTVEPERKLSPVMVTVVPADDGVVGLMEIMSGTCTVYAKKSVVFVLVPPIVRTCT